VLVVAAGLCALAFAPARAQAQEAQLSLGLIDVKSLAGCCVSGTAPFGVGLTVRFSELGFVRRPFELSGFSSGHWTEFSVGMSRTLLGDDFESDPTTSSGVSVVNVPDWILRASYGLGFVIHSTETKNYDLPVLVPAVLFYLRADLLYNINDEWALSFIADGGSAVAGNYWVFRGRLLLGPRYRF
jgi:hypothetical protein